jgi:NADH:ubiquinone oxidoreductase subunit 5 (subunit L)/multisubunit Na+/H+ antiporter MnhA subunit
MSLPLWILALLSLAVGIYSTLTGHVLQFGPEAGHEAPSWLMPAAVGVAVAGILLAWLTYQRRAIDAGALAAAFGPIRRAALARFWIDDLFAGAYRGGLLAFSRGVGWVDRYLVDGLLNAVSAWTLTAGDDVRMMQTGRAQDYVVGVAAGLLALLLWVQWT